MSETKKWTIPATTVEKLKDIANKFSQLNTGAVGDEFWLIEQEDSAGDYEGDALAVGINKKGELIQAYSSHCSCDDSWDAGMNAYGNQPLEGELVVDFSGQIFSPHDNWLPELKKTANTLYKVLNNKSVSPQEVIGLPNAEVRRAVIEVVGYNKLTKEAKTTDTSSVDGELMTIELPEDENLNLLHVKDPSTAREYFLRVPPNIKTAKEARAWTFGFEAEDFNPVKET
jgi:hypothetical protein